MVVTVVIVSAVFCGEYLVGDGSAGIDTKVEAVAATRPLLPAVASHWRVSRVALVREPHLFETVAGFPSGGLGRRGFPGPVWVVLVSVEDPCGRGGRDKTLTYVFEAASGNELVSSWIRCNAYHPNVARG